MRFESIFVESALKNATKWFKFSNPISIDGFSTFSIFQECRLILSRLVYRRSDCSWVIAKSDNEKIDIGGLLNFEGCDILRE